MTVRAERYEDLCEEHGVVGYDEHDGRRWALIERGSHSTYVTTHETPTDAATYNATQEDSRWPLALVDLDTGEQYEDTQVVTTTFAGLPEEGGR